MANRKSARNDAELFESETWGVPNWKNVNNYPAAAQWEKMHRDSKKWEFLRRTKEYRKDWERSQLKAEKPPTAESKILTVKIFDGKALAAKYKMSHILSPTISHANLPKGFNFIRPIVTESGGFIVYPNKPLGHKTKDYCEINSDTMLAAYAEQLAKPEIPKDWYDMRVWVEFDLTYGLDEQLKKAKINLMSASAEVGEFMNAWDARDDQYSPDDYAPVKVRERNKRGMNKDNAPSEELPIISLLRVFDAKNCGRTNAQIAMYWDDTKNTDSSTISKRYKIASQLWKIL